MSTSHTSDFKGGSGRGWWGLCVVFGRWHLGCFQDSELWSHWYFHCKQCFLWTILQQWDRIATTERLQSLQLEIQQWVPQQHWELWKTTKEKSSQQWRMSCWEFENSSNLAHDLIHSIFLPCMFEYIIWIHYLMQLNLQSSWQIANGWGRNENNMKKVVNYVIWYTMQVDCQSVSKRNMFLLSLKNKMQKPQTTHWKIYFFIKSHIFSLWLQKFLGFAVELT